MPPINRRKFLKVSAALAASGAIAVAADGILLEPNHPRLVRVDIALKRLPEAWEGLRIVQLSDFHYDEHFSAVPLRKAVDIVNGLRPDAVFLTGDFVTVPLFGRRSSGITAIGPCAEILSRLQAPLGLFAVLGNHDVRCGSATVMQTLRANKIEVLRNHALPLEKDGGRIWLAGVDDVIEGKADLSDALLEVPREEPVILLAHEPDFADQVVNAPVDLQLSGHSHGGQIRLPLVGAPYLPEMAQKYPMGLYRIGRLTLYTNVGLGTIRVPVRWNCPPEVTLLTLRKARDVS